MSEDRIERLSEGYDFIEEAVGYSLPLEFSEVTETTISEAEGKGSPFAIIGRAKGQFQPCGEFSRNGRLYESDHWDCILGNPQFQDRIKSRDIMGCIGHADKKVDDKDISEGKVSHIVSVLEKRIDEKTGTPYLYGELEILDTPAGRNLKALYEGGANLYVSSRGAGKLLPVPGQTYKMVDKGSYFCETFDIVRRPGFLKAKPMFEHIPTNENVNEAEISETSEKTLTNALRERTLRHFDTTDKLDSEWEKAHAKGDRETAKKVNDKYDEELDKQEKKLELYKKALDRVEKDNKKDVNEDEVLVLKNQVEQLAQLLEKVVDTVYEREEENCPTCGSKKEECKCEEHKKQHEALAEFTELMASSGISEEAFEDIINTIKRGLN